MAQKHKSSGAFGATQIVQGSDRKTSPLVMAALRQTLREEKLSVRRAAALMSVSRSTIERYLARGHEIPELRSHRIAWGFLRNLRVLVAVRNGHIDAHKRPLRTPGHVATVRRPRAKRQTSARSAKKRDGAKGAR